MASLTASISAVVTIVSSSQLFTALNQDQPKGPLAVMAIAGLIGAGLVAVANTIAKLIGKLPVTGVAALPMAEFATWVVPDEPDALRVEKQSLLEQRIRTALGPWRPWDKEDQAVTRIGESWSATGVSTGRTSGAW